ncbi:hypothetical protein B0T14DRAFT_502266 [Immersiella caudata]|uniref:Secreted protein n=1 Tax=Immersiella caudata TaxID=314043 RepID=A0AA40CBW8_9PEZI|nr:hypothetical protein B0T14DRAFT_502266 [Immersiella caudata]
MKLRHWAVVVVFAGRAGSLCNIVSVGCNLSRLCGWPGVGGFDATFSGHENWSVAASSSSTSHCARTVLSTIHSREKGLR